MKKSKISYTIVLFLLSFQFGYSQVERTTVSLKSILDKISMQHDIVFNYIEDEIVIFSLSEPNEKWVLHQKIDYIQKETKLHFKVVSDRFYTVYNEQNLDKPLCGFLIDNKTQLPIENAYIYIENTVFSTSSDANGYFELPKVSPNKIIVNHLGYQAHNINPETLYVNNCPKINLISKIINLEEVITEQYLTSGIIKKKDGTIVINPKKYGILPGLIEADILQTMLQIPGILSTNETISNINVRGGTHDQNLFLWNGIRIFQTGHFFGLISAFNPSINHSVTISKNGTSAFYGESISSVVDISTHSKTISDTETNISANLLSADFYTKIKTSKSCSFQVSGRRSLTDLFDSPTSTSYKKRVYQNTSITNLSNNQEVFLKTNDTFYFYDFTFQYQQKVGKNHEFFFDGIAIENNLKINQFTASQNKNSALKQYTFGGVLNWKTNWNANLSTLIKVYNSNYNLDAKNQTLAGNQIIIQKNAIQNRGISIKNNQTLSETLKLSYGYQWDELGVINNELVNSPVFFKNNKDVLQINALIAETEFLSKKGKTFFLFGLRGNYFEKFQSLRFEPRLQFSQKLNNFFRLEVLAEQKSQVLTQKIDFQQDFMGIENRKWTLTDNSNTPIQKSNQLSLGLNFKKNNWLVIFDNYYKLVKNIASHSQGFKNQFEFLSSIGKYDIIGTELLIQKNYQKFYGWISYGFTSNKYTFESFTPSKFPNNFEISHAIAAAVSYDCNNLKTAIGIKWHSGTPTTSPLSNFINYTDPNNPKIDYRAPNSTNIEGYLQGNLSVSKKWATSKNTSLEIGLSVLNTFNNKNIISTSYRINNQNNTIEKIDTYALETTQNINLKFTL